MGKTADDRLGKYHLQRQLASGGMGEVFFARQEGPQGFAKAVVVKRILAHLARDPSFVEMFLNEARLAALLAHPNIVQIFELGEEKGTYFIAMEFVHGRTLRSVKGKLRAEQRPFPPAYAARIASAALHGLHYAHTLRGESGERLGIIHRDMSPDNIMVGFNGSVKLLDFGIAKVEDAAGTTDAGTVKGKRAYMSPEQLDGAKLDGRTDVWSIGVLLYELIAGVRPFPAEDEGPLVKQIVTTEPQPLAERDPAVPAALSAIVKRALEKDVAKRFPTAEAMANALERFCSSAQVSLTDNETAAFMSELYADEDVENPATGSMPGGAGVSGLYLSGSNPMEMTKLSAVFTAVKNRWRALTVGLIAAGGLVAGAWALSLWGATKPVPAAPPPDAIAALPVPAADPDPGPPPVPDPPDPGQAPAADPAPTPTPAPAGQKGAHHGKVDLRVTPWAEVFEGKKKIGVTPMQPIELAAGKHTLTLKNPDLSVSRVVAVKVPKDATVTVRVDLRK